ncbi:MAG: hypothetical protein K2W82_16445 [Candidatus Obscuribacterales bacterium]|nr:hypothetical protein [Candidatus Obscuribacterales bacterium]
MFQWAKRRRLLKKVRRMDGEKIKFRLQALHAKCTQGALNEDDVRELDIMQEVLGERMTEVQPKEGVPSTQAELIELRNCSREISQRAAVAAAAKAQAPAAVLPPVKAESPAQAPQAAPPASKGSWFSLDWLFGPVESQSGNKTMASAEDQVRRLEKTVIDLESEYARQRQILDALQGRANKWQHNEADRLKDDVDRYKKQLAFWRQRLVEEQAAAQQQTVVAEPAAAEPVVEAPPAVDLRLLEEKRTELVALASSLSRLQAAIAEKEQHLLGLQQVSTSPNDEYVLQQKAELETLRKAHEAETAEYKILYADVLELSRKAQAQGSSGGAKASAATPETGSTGKEALPVKRFYSYRREPDAPFRPHRFNSRVDKIGELKTAKILITPEAYKRMFLYVDIGQQEVGWLGTVTQLENGDFLIDQTYLLEQEVSAVETELSTVGQAKLAEELIAKATGDDDLEDLNRLRFWGHSHVRMGVSPSGTDERTMERFGRDGMPWYIRGIFNKVGDAVFDIYYYDRGYRILDVPWMVWDPESERAVLTGSGRDSKTFWSKSKDDGEKVLKAKPVPSLLVPSAELRAEVETEFKAKVTAASSAIFRWAGSGWGGGGNQYSVPQIVPGGDRAEGPSAAPTAAPSSAAESAAPQYHPYGDGEISTDETGGDMQRYVRACRQSQQTPKQEPPKDERGFFKGLIEDVYDDLFLPPDGRRK